jgi:HrpA-like RNA helicase
MSRNFGPFENNPVVVGTDPARDFAALPPELWPQQWRPSEDYPTPQSAVEDDFSKVVSDGMQFSPDGSSFRLGENWLPIAPYRKFIVDTITNNQTTVISSETGSGKSSQLGLYLLEAGAPRVFVTQPRIIAARELKERAQHNLGPNYQHLAGYLTGDSSDSDCHPDARLIYVTEQLLFKMANRGKLGPEDVVINDEAHERTAGTVILLGLMKELLKDNPDMRLVVSSATIDTGRFSQYLTHTLTGRNAPVMILPGRTFPITETSQGRSVVDAARAHMRDGKNVLAFEPGNARLRATAAKMESRNSAHTVHQLFGDQSPATQKEALAADDGNHIVSTRIGETSLTPQNKQAVVDSGLSNVGRYSEGKRILKTVFSSKATMQQRRGRVGRTEPGVYEIAVPEGVPEPPVYEARDDYDEPDIQNTSVAAFIAELHRSDRRIEDLDLLEYPTQANLHHDYKVLRRLGGLATKDGIDYLSESGAAMTDLPLDVPLARMVIEARTIADTHEVDAEKVRLQVAAAAAIGGVNGILNGRQDSKRRYLLSRKHEENLSTEQTSDVLFGLDVFTNVYQAHQEMLRSDASEEVIEQRLEALLEKKDLLPNRYHKALKLFEELCRREQLDAHILQKPEPAERQAIVACQISGADELFVQKSKLVHWDIRGEKRMLGRRSTIAPHAARLVIGSAFDLDSMRETGRFTKQYISGASAVTTEQLLAQASQRISRKSVGYALTRDGAIVERQALYFDGEIQFDEIKVAPSPTTATREVLLTAMMTGSMPSDGDPTRHVAYDPGTPNAQHAIRQLEKARALDHRSHANLLVEERHTKLLNKIIRESIDRVPLDITDPTELDALIPRVYVNALVRPSRKKDIPEIVRTSPDAILVPVNEEHKIYLPISYKHNIAYVTVPKELQYVISRDSIAELEEYHGVKLRLGNNKYVQSDVFFQQIDEQRNSPNRQKRLQRRAEAAASVEAPTTYNPPARRRSDSERQLPQLDEIAWLNATLQASRQRRRHFTANRE